MNKKPRINETIRISPVFLIDNNGNKIGVVPTQEALKIAREQNLDLVEIVPNQRPPVCKIIDYGKYCYDQKKKQKDKNHSKKVQLKQIRFTPNIGDHDILVKCNKINSFLKDHMKVQIKVNFSKREIAFKKLGYEVIEKVLKNISDYGKLHEEPKMNGRVLIALIEPLELE